MNNMTKESILENEFIVYELKNYIDISHLCYL